MINSPSPTRRADPRLPLHNWPYLGFSVTGAVSHSLSFHPPKRPWLSLKDCYAESSLSLTDTHTHKICATDLTSETSQCSIFLKLQSFPTQRALFPSTARWLLELTGSDGLKNIVSFLFGFSFIGKVVPYLLEQWTGHRASNESASFWLTWVWLVGWPRKSRFSVFIA